MWIDLCLAANDRLASNFSFFELLLIIFIWLGIITVKTFQNIIEPIIKPTLKKANFAPKIFVRLKEIRANKIKIIDKKSTLLFIILDLHKRS